MKADQDIRGHQLPVPRPAAFPPEVHHLPSADPIQAAAAVFRQAVLLRRAALLLHHGHQAVHPPGEEDRTDIQIRLPCCFIVVIDEHAGSPATGDMPCELLNKLMYT